MSWGVVPDGAGCGRARSQPGPVAAGPGRRCTAPRSPRSVEFRVEIGSVPHRDRFRRDRCPPPDRRQPGSRQTGRMRAGFSQSGTGSARRAGARPRDSKDRSKALGVAPTRLPRIVNPHPTLRTPPPADRRPSTRGATPRGADTDRLPTGRTLKKIQAHNTARTQNVNAPETSQHALTHLQVRGASRQVPEEVATCQTSVLMHLQVRGASRLQESTSDRVTLCCLNAPTGAWCFPTDPREDDPDPIITS